MTSKFGLAHALPFLPGPYCACLIRLILQHCLNGSNGSIKVADLEPDIVGVLGFPKAASPEAEVCLKSEGKPRESKLPKPPWRRVRVLMEVKRENIQCAATVQVYPPSFSRIFRSPFRLRDHFWFVPTLLSTSQIDQVFWVLKTLIYTK
jgi:hypothetical protein